MRARDFQKPVIDMLEQGCLELARALEDKPLLLESFEAWNETQSLLAKITGETPKIGQKYSVLNLIVIPPGKMLLQQGSSRPIKLIGIKDRGSHLQYEFDAGDRIVLFPEDHRSGDQLSKTFLYSNPLDLKKIQTFITLNLDGWDVRDLVTENFADGKIKGRSRPGRVKRAGASCKGSVTDLRARARKYGGERGKMYHWCANMKSGRQKSKK